MDTSTSTTCPYCGVGCGISVRVKDDRIIAVSGDSSHPANRGKLCIKGTAVHKTLGEHGRLLHPQVDKCTTDWPSAIQTVASRLTEVREKYGPQAIAFYLSGQLLTEDYYVANKLAKGFIGTANVDTNSRLCMSSAVAAHKRAFGADIVPCNYSDLEQAQLLVLVGSNAAWTHPVLYQRMVAAKQKNPDLKVVVIDPRRTATCDIADLHLAARPGADSVIFSGLLNYLAAHNHLDKTYITNHTSGFENAVHSAGHWTLAAVANRVNLDQRQLARFYQWFAQTDKTVTFFSQGINQSAAGTDSGNAIINCHLATGRIGQPGAGPFSITGQPNAMGGREVGGLANMLAAHMDYSPENCATVADFWGSEHVAQAPGLKAVDLFDGVSRGEIRAIWIMGTNPVVSMPDADKVKAALQQCDTVIVSDCVAATDTTATADILLPAMGWGEKSGTVTNSERCISRQRPLLPAPGDARADWWILSRVASAMGYSGFAYQSPRDIFTEHAALSGFRNQGQRLFDISALSDLSADQYDQLQPIRWPVNREHPNGSERLFSDGQFATDDGRARFVAITARLPERRLNKQFPLALNSGRIRDQWHTMTRTGRAPELLNHSPHPFVAIHPETASHYHLKKGALARVRTTHGSAELLVEIDSGITREQLFVPIHWNDQFASRARIDALVAPLTDPVSGQPEFKYTPASIEPVDSAFWAVAVTRTPWRSDSFPYWHCTPLAQGRGYCYTATAGHNFDWQQWLEHACQAHTGHTQLIKIENPSQEERRFTCWVGEQLQWALFTHTELDQLPSNQWLQSLLMSPAAVSRQTVLQGEQEASVGKIICSCWQVQEARIVQAIDAGANSCDALGEQLKCGTNCGSCIPELNQLIAQRAITMAS